MELRTYNDFKNNEFNTVYGVIYTSELKTGILPVADDIAVGNMKITDLLKPVKPTEFTIIKKSEILLSDNLLIKYIIDPPYHDWMNKDIPYEFYRECKHSPDVFGIIYNVTTKELKSPTEFGRNRGIHLFTAKEECENFVNSCNKIILDRIIKYYNKKITQYTSTVNEIKAKFDSIL